ncbi:endonuclease NucS [Candidatus Woesearchaeota archaeon]|nr:endonuclease NucS [Candidatus Woesearchaeota archaeon]
MELGDFRAEFDDALARNECLSFFCSCEIAYSGRAEAHLAQGDRMIFIKNDNTLLIHQPVGSAPINYMKAGGHITLKPVSGNGQKYLHLKCVTADLKEYLDVQIFRVHTFMHHKLEDGAKQELAGNERDMSDMLKENPHLISDDFKPLSREEHTKFGFIDVFGHDKKGNLVIVECKRYTAGLDAVTQLRRYVEKIEELKGVKNVKGILAAPTISPNAKEMLEKWGFSFKAVEPPMRLDRFNKSQKSLVDW